MTVVSPITTSFFLQSGAGRTRIDRTVTELLTTRSAHMEQITDHVASRRCISFTLATECVLDSLDRLYTSKTITLDLDNDGVFVYRLA